MSDYDFHDGLECPSCGSNQTEESKHKKDHWFCYLCGRIWNPEETED